MKQQHIFIHTAFGSLAVRFSDTSASTLTLTTIGLQPIVFFGVKWNVWLVMHKTASGNGWDSGYKLGSSRAEDADRASRSTCSASAARTISSALIEALNGIIDTPDFIEGRRIAEERIINARLADLRGEQMQCQSELDAATIRLSDFEALHGLTKGKKKAAKKKTHRNK